MKKRIPIIVHLRWNFQFAQDVIAGLHSNSSALDLKLIVVNGDQELSERQFDSLSPRAVVGDSHYSKTIEICANRKIPFIDLTGSSEESGLHRILPDDDKIGQMAADYLREAGYGHFAFIGYSDQAYSGRRERAFRRALGETEVHAYQSRLSPYLLGAEEPGLGEFLKSLPSPCGVFACSDLRATAIYPFMESASRHIPDKLGILGVDADLVLRRITGHRLSSIDQAAWFQGWKAGQWVDQLIRDYEIPPRTYNMTPVQVIDFNQLVLETDMHPMVRRFMSALQNHYAQPDALIRALDEVPLSRRSIESLTRKLLGASPLNLLHRTRLKVALNLLANPDLPISEIARQTGFEYQGDFNRFIMKAVGLQPGVIRKGLKSSSAPNPF